MIEKREVKQHTMSYKDVGDDTFDMSVTEWVNGDGFDIDIYNTKMKEESFSLTWEDFNALSMLIQSFNVRNV